MRLLAWAKLSKLSWGKLRNREASPVRLSNLDRRAMLYVPFAYSTKVARKRLTGREVKRAQSRCSMIGTVVHGCNVLAGYALTI